MTAASPLRAIRSCDWRTTAPFSYQRTLRINQHACSVRRRCTHLDFEVAAVGLVSVHNTSAGLLHTHAHGCVVHVLVVFVRASWPPASPLLALAQGEWWPTKVTRAFIRGACHNRALEAGVCAAERVTTRIPVSLPARSRERSHQVHCEYTCSGRRTVHHRRVGCKSHDNGGDH